VRCLAHGGRLSDCGRAHRGRAASFELRDALYPV
jgi:hypothetical protein